MNKARLNFEKLLNSDTPLSDRAVILYLIDKLDDIECEIKNITTGDKIIQGYVTVKELYQFFFQIGGFITLLLALIYTL